MASEDVDSNDGLVEFGVSRLNDIVVEMLLVAKRVHALEDELEQSLEILGRGRSDKDVGISVGESGSDGETESGGFTSTSGSSEGDGGREGLFGNGLDERKNGFGLKEESPMRNRNEVSLADASGWKYPFILMPTYLIECLCQLDQLPDRLSVFQALLEHLELGTLLSGLAFASVGDGKNVLAARYRKNVEFVVENKAVVARAKRKDESFVESGDNRGVGVCSVSVVDIL